MKKDTRSLDYSHVTEVLQELRVPGTHIGAWGCRVFLVGKTAGSSFSAFPSFYN